ncbi:MAG: bifunctional histidinol-phosphatase/imidazoleglycerol-phosphate dehydratase HisB [Candidatus Coatesbacteria bacterium]|nr:bifunctional histidinol-phosphatase/imidazoleglycerol-phosphate dehydratase HisB [Candidatus Coatesbacteria bacterium]
MKKVLFVDRDGTLIVEPSETHQVNSLEELEFIPFVISSLKKFFESGYEIVIVTNQDGLGTPANSLENFNLVNSKMFQVFESEGISFSQVFICRHYAKENCECRKPKTGMVSEYLSSNEIDIANSIMVGDRLTDVEFAENLGIRGFLLSSNLGWQEITKKVLARERTSSISRKTNETDIKITLNIDGSGKFDIETGIGFFNHMLEQFAKHGSFDLEIEVSGDLNVDEHHTIEDVALALGECIKLAIGDKKGIERFAWERILIMDESRSEVSIDISGRPHVEFTADFDKEYAGDFPTEMVKHFFESLCSSAQINAHIMIYGDNTHHKIESAFKAFARCLRDAVRITSDEISSTKGVL